MIQYTWPDYNSILIIFCISIDHCQHIAPVTIALYLEVDHISEIVKRHDVKRSEMINQGLIIGWNFVRLQLRYISQSVTSRQFSVSLVFKCSNLETIFYIQKKGQDNNTYLKYKRRKCTSIAKSTLTFRFTNKKCSYMTESKTKIDTFKAKYDSNMWNLKHWTGS